MSPGGGAGPRAAAIVATAAVAFAAAVWAQPVPYLVKDIHQTPNPRASANPRLIRSAGDVAFFAAQGHDGLDLWRTDGTAPGTFRLAAVRNGIAEMVTVGARAFLSVYGSGLWVSDGTVAGTRYLGPPLDPVSRRHPQRLTPVGSLLLYAFSDPEHGVEVWRSDGTVGGTFMVVDLRPGPEDGLHPFDSTPFAVVAGEAFYRGFPDESGVEVRATSGAPGESRLVWSFPSPIGLGPLRAVGGRLWFTVWDGEQGVELWDSDGTTMGTHMVVDPPDLVDVDSVATVGDRTYFAATRPTEGTELWSTDGSPGGLGLVADVHPGPASSRPRELLGAGEALYFLADPPPDEPGGPASDQLWTLVGDELTPLLPPSSLHSLAAVDEGVFFARDEQCDVHCRGQWRLWRSDGTPGGTLRVTGQEGPLVGPGSITPFQGGILFSATDGVHGAELWRSDGSDEGTFLLKDVYRQSGHSTPEPILAAGGLAFITAEDGLHGRQVWASDGTSTGTVRLTEFDLPAGMGPKNLAALGSRILFTVESGSSSEVWSSNGTPSGTGQIRFIPAKVETAVSTGDLVYLTAHDAQGVPQLWGSDGTQAGTSGLAAFSAGGVPMRLTGAGSRAYFTAALASHGRELWTSDGTVAGTRMVLDLTPGPDSSEVTNLNAFGDRVALVLGSSCGQQELWIADPTGATRVLENACPSSRMAEMGGRLYFAARNAAGRRVLWSTDGTPPGTVEEIPLADESPFGVQRFGDRLIVFGSDDPDRVLLWSTDGSVAGTHFMGRFERREIGLLVAVVGTARGRAYIVVRHVTSFPSSPFPPWGTAEIWSSDGTQAGTRFLFESPMQPPHLARLTVGRDLLFMNGYDQVRGAEFWAASLDDGAACTGDCDEDGTVTLAEFGAAIRRALGDVTAPCPVLDRIGPVTVDRLVATVAGLLYVCPSVSSADSIAPL